MNKEQFKKSISNLIFHYIGNMISYERQQVGADEEIKEMIKAQANGLNMAFSVSLDDIINKFVGEADESKVSGEE